MDDPTLTTQQLGLLKERQVSVSEDKPAEAGPTLSALFGRVLDHSKLDVRKCAPGEVVFYEGRHDDTMYVIQSGEVAIIKGNFEDPVVLAYRGKGEILGEMALLDDQPHSASVVALDTVKLLCVRRSDFQKLLNTDPVLVMRIMSTLSSRLRMAEDLRTAISRLEHKMSRELEVAGQVQAHLLPASVPSLAGWDLAAALVAARQTSGDYYDFIPFPDGGLGVLVADVTDKGAAAALVMAVSRTLIYAFALQHPDNPARVFEIANERLLVDTNTDLFVTVFYCVLHPDRGIVTYANAGHNAIYLVRASGEVEMLGRTGLPLGTFEDLAWETHTLELRPGDRLLLYTDGLMDARRADRERFGKERTEGVIRSQAGRSAQEMIDALLGAVQDFTGDAPQFDDITLVAVVRH